jgi:hypothetical protein
MPRPESPTKALAVLAALARNRGELDAETLRRLLRAAARGEAPSRI